jgi:hypothetical protein
MLIAQFPFKIHNETYWEVLVAVIATYVFVKLQNVRSELSEYCGFKSQWLHSDNRRVSKLTKLLLAVIGTTSADGVIFICRCLL